MWVLVCYSNEPAVSWRVLLEPVGPRRQTAAALKLLFVEAFDSQIFVLSCLRGSSAITAAKQQTVASPATAAAIGIGSGRSAVLVRHLVGKVEARYCQTLQPRARVPESVLYNDM